MAGLEWKSVGMRQMSPEEFREKTILDNQKRLRGGEYAGMFKQAHFAVQLQEDIFVSSDNYFGPYKYKGTLAGEEPQEEYTTPEWI